MKKIYQIEVELYNDEKPILLREADLIGGMFGLDGAVMATIEKSKDLPSCKAVVYLSCEDSLESMWECDLQPDTCESTLWGTVKSIEDFIEDAERSLDGINNT